MKFTRLSLLGCRTATCLGDVAQKIQRFLSADIERDNIGSLCTAAAPPPERAGVEPPLAWLLALDEITPTGMDVRSHLPMEGRPTMAEAKGPIELEAAPVELKPLELDPLTVADDADFLTRVAAEKNLPDFIKQGLPLLYS